MGAALLWDSLLCPHAIMHLNHQLMHSKRREQSCVQHQRFSAHWGLGLCAFRNRSALSCPDSRGSAHPSTPTYSSLRHHSRGSGSTASAGRGLTGVSTCKLFTLLEGEQASRSLGDAKCPEGLWRDRVQSWNTTFWGHGTAWKWVAPNSSWSLDCGVWAVPLLKRIFWQGSGFLQTVLNPSNRNFCLFVCFGLFLMIS